MENPKKDHVFSFKKVNNKWKFFVNPNLVFHLSSSFGLPVEILNNQIKELPREKILKMLFIDWQHFCEINNIDTKGLEIISWKDSLKILKEKLNETNITKSKS